jgi:hypothetical protein
MTRTDGHPPEQTTIHEVPEFWPGIGARDMAGNQTAGDPDAWLEAELAGIQKGFEEDMQAKGYVAADTHLYKVIVALRKRANGDWRK